MIFEMNRIVAAVAAVLICWCCSERSGAPFGQDVSDILEQCADGTLLGYDLKQIDTDCLSDDFLSLFNARAGYDLKEVWSKIDTLEDRGRFVPYIFFDYRSAVIDLWRAGYEPECGAPASPVNGQRLLLLYSDVDLTKACAGADSLEVNRSEKAGSRLSEKHFDFDFVSDTTVRAGLDVRGKHIVSPAGTRYDALVVPGNDAMLPATLASLLDAVKRGAAVVFESDVPMNVPGLVDKGKIEAMGAMLEEVGLKPWNDMYYAKYGRGHIVVSHDIVIALLSMGLEMNK